MNEDAKRIVLLGNDKEEKQKLVDTMFSDCKRVGDVYLSESLVVENVSLPDYESGDDDLNSHMERNAVEAIECADALLFISGWNDEEVNRTKSEFTAYAEKAQCPIIVAVSKAEGVLHGHCWSSETGPEAIVRERLEESLAEIEEAFCAVTEEPIHTLYYTLGGDSKAGEIQPYNLAKLACLLEQAIGEDREMIGENRETWTNNDDDGWVFDLFEDDEDDIDDEDDEDCLDEDESPLEDIMNDLGDALDDIDTDEVCSKILKYGALGIVGGGLIGLLLAAGGFLGELTKE